MILDQLIECGIILKNVLHEKLMTAAKYYNNINIKSVLLISIRCSIGFYRAPD